MAFCASAPSFCSLIGAHRWTSPSKASPRPCFRPHIRCAAQTPPRRSANYQPSSWSDEYIQSLRNDTKVEEDNARRMGKLTEDVKQLIYMKKGMEEQLQLIDHLQLLGVAYHFKEDIKDAFGTIYGSVEKVNMLLKDNLHATSLMFRLLREHGFDVSEGVFYRFMDEKGNLKASLRHQTEGLVSLYEASHLAKEGEHVLEEAKNFTTKQLKSLMEGSLEPHLREHVAHALELPLNWRMPRLQTRWFIEACQREANINPVLLELAKLDFNRVQSIQQRELREVSRWDVNTMDKLPEYMKICFLALFNTTNDTAYNVMKEKVPLYKQYYPLIQWADVCKVHMVEARWYHQGYTPNLEEYLENALLSISGP
ncbi:unnamed protein product [Musa hybrid cultivar]